MMAEILHRVVQDSTFVNRRVDIVDMQLVPPILCKWPRPMRWSFWPWVSSSRPSSCHYSLRGSNRKIKTLLEQMNLVGRSGGLMGVWTGSSNIGRSFISKRMIVGSNKTNSAAIVSGTGKGGHLIADHWLPIFNKNYLCKWWICQMSSSCHFARISVSHLCHVLDIPHSHDAPFRRFSFLRSVGYESRNRSKLPPFRFRSQLHLDSSCHKNSHTTVQCGWLEKKGVQKELLGQSTLQSTKS